jgi:hypothetical protein
VDPQVMTREQWEQISRALNYLYLFTGLGLTGALAFLLSHAILPSLIASGDARPVVGALRWVAYPLAAAALALAAYALTRGLLIAVSVTQEIYPRTWI